MDDIEDPQQFLDDEFIYSLPQAKFNTTGVYVVDKIRMLGQIPQYMDITRINVDDGCGVSGKWSISSISYPVTLNDAMKHHHINNVWTFLWWCVARGLIKAGTLGDLEYESKVWPSVCRRGSYLCGMINTMSRLHFAKKDAPAIVQQHTELATTNFAKTKQASHSQQVFLMTALYPLGAAIDMGP